MKFIRNFMKKELNECLKEEKMYTINDDRVLSAILNLNYAISMADKLQMMCNSLEDRLEHPERGIEKIDLELMKNDLKYLKGRIEATLEVLPDRHYY